MYWALWTGFCIGKCIAGCLLLLLSFCSWTTLFTIPTIPFINHFREWAHFIYFPFTNRYSTLSRKFRRYVWLDSGHGWVLESKCFFLSEKDFCWVVFSSCSKKLVGRPQKRTPTLCKLTHQWKPDVFPIEHVLCSFTRGLTFLLVFSMAMNLNDPARS